jgi:hypothetical protein
MEPISIFVIFGLAVLAISIKHLSDTCKIPNNEQEPLIDDDEIPPKYEDIS